MTCISRYLCSELVGEKPSPKDQIKGLGRSDKKLRDLLEDSFHKLGHQSIFCGLNRRHVSISPTSSMWFFLEHLDRCRPAKRQEYDFLSDPTERIFEL